MSCSNDGVIQSKTVIFSSCFVTDDAMDSAMDLDTGHVTIPANGFYEISFTGAMKTFDGNRMWATIVKKTSGSKGSFVTQLCSRLASEESPIVTSPNEKCLVSKKAKSN